MLTRRYYGNSAIFVWRSVYEHLGGFRPWPLFEDYDFSNRLQRAGRCAYVREVSVYASARRFDGRDLTTLFKWTGLQALYMLACRPAWLATFYPDVRGTRPTRFKAEWQRRTEKAPS